MRVAITGSRDWGEDRYGEVREALSRLDPSCSFVVLGDARGVDTLARKACIELGFQGRSISSLEDTNGFRVHVARWDVYGKGAGPVRNARMLDDLENGGPEVQRELWWFHDDLESSLGTKNCVEQAIERGIVVRNWQLLRLA